MPLDEGARVDQVKPEGRWAFDEEVAASFDDMLARSIPQYDVMRGTVTDLAGRFIRKRTDAKVVDLGASRGEALAHLEDRHGSSCEYFAVEVADSMLRTLQERWPPEDEGHRVRIIPHDLRLGYPKVPITDVTLCVLTLQFTPIEHRQRILHDVFNHTVPGGALILVEKVLGATHPLDSIFVDEYLSLKGANGYSPEQIERKRLSLEGVLVPVTAAWNEELLRTAGFTEVDCFWRWCNFAGWVAIR